MIIKTMLWNPWVASCVGEMILTTSVIVGIFWVIGLLLKPIRSSRSALAEQSTDIEILLGNGVCLQLLSTRWTMNDLKQISCNSFVGVQGIPREHEGERITAIRFWEDGVRYVIAPRSIRLLERLIVEIESQHGRVSGSITTNDRKRRFDDGPCERTIHESSWL